MRFSSSLFSCVLGVFAAGASGLVASSAAAVTVSLACGSVGMETEVCNAGVRNREAKTGNTVKRAKVLGGHQLDVSKYTRPPKKAVDLVRFLTSASKQKRRCIAASFDPPRPAPYSDPQVLASSSYLPMALGAYENVLARLARITSLKYNQVSYEFWNAVHDALAGRATPADVIKTKLERISRYGRW